MMLRITAWMLLALSTVAARAADSPFAALYDLDALPVLRSDTRTLQVSSTDPTGGNADAGHFVRVDGRTKVLADLTGPGVVRRIWSANPTGRLRIYIDGASQPALDAPFADVFDGKVPGFRPPVARRSSGGWVSYVPVPFARSCLITVTDGEWFYYQVTWQRLAADAAVSSYTGEWPPSDQASYEAAVDAWNSLGDNTPSRGKPLNLPARNVSIPPGGRWAQPIVGPGTITELRFRFGKDAGFAALRQAVLRITFDDEKAPSVEAPLGDFFGLGAEGVSWKSLPMGADAYGAWCYYRMPFRKRAVIEIENTGPRPFAASFSGAASSLLPRGKWGYFHATWNSAVNSRGRDYRFAKLVGAGHVVGVTQTMRGIGNQWFLEGDESVYRDGDTAADIQGTGTEDFYNCGWYFNTGLISAATHGAGLKAENEVMAFRMLVPDPIPFSTSLDFRVEHGGGNDVPGSEYSSVTYWYGAPGAAAQTSKMARGAALLPRPYVPPAPNAVQAEALQWKADVGGSVKTQAWHEVSPYRGGGRIVLIGGPGAEVTTEVEVGFDDNYDVELHVSGANTGSVARLLLDGRPVGDAIRDGAGPLPVRKVTLGPVFLSEGKHSIGVMLESGAKVGLDAFRLVSRSPLVRDFAVIGPFPVNPKEGVNTPLPPDGKSPNLRVMHAAAGGRLLGWSILQAPNGFLDLGSTLVPNENVVAYASFAVRAPEDGAVLLAIGADDGVKVFLNGRDVFTNRVDRGYVPDQDRVRLDLKRGWNTVVIKVDQSEKAWALSARIPDPQRRLEFAAMAPVESAEKR